jgi:pRiA4b ORF-3-like protein
MGGNFSVRLEQRAAIKAERPYPVCVGGRWAGPPEDCGGPKAFLERRAAAGFGDTPKATRDG